MDIEDLTKIVFFTGYNYHLRYYNILRKINDLEKNAQKLQKIVNDDYKPLIFKGGEIQKNGKKIFEVKEIKIDIKSNLPRISSSTIKTSSIPYTEECKFYLMVEIILEVTQYCADLATIMIGLREFKTNKMTFSHINDATIKKWYKKLDEPSLKDIVKIFDLKPLNELNIEERFIIALKYDKLLWNLNKIGRFYWHNYDYLYTPLRHGMKGSFCKDSENHVFCRTLTKDKKWNFYYLSEERINKCKEIADLIFSIFHDELNFILINKAISPPLEIVKTQIPNTPKLPVKSFNPKNIRKIFTDLINITIYYFPTENISSIHEFASNPENNIKFRYKKMKKGSSLIEIDGVEHYLDELFSFSKKIKKKDFVIICNCPLAYYVELTYISIKSHQIYGFMMSQIKEYIYHYLAIEKDLNYLLHDPLKIIHRANQFTALTNEIMKDFILLIGLHINDNIFKKLQFSNEEKNFLIYILKKKLIRLINSKNLITKYTSDIMLQIIFNLLIIDYLETNQLESFIKDLKIKNLSSILKSSSNYIRLSVKDELTLDVLLNFLNSIYDFIDRLGVAY